MSKAGTGKQGTLYGFFTKPASTARPAPAQTPATPSTTSSSNHGGSSGSSSTSSHAYAKTVALAAAAERRASLSSSALKQSIELSSDGIEEDVERTSTPAFSKSKRNALNSVPTPPLTSENDERTASGASSSEMDVDNEEEEEDDVGVVKKASVVGVMSILERPLLLIHLVIQSRSAKRQVILSEGESDDADVPPKKVSKSRMSDNETSKPPKTQVVTTKKAKKATSPADSTEDEEQSGDEYGDEGIDWDEAAAMSDGQVKRSKAVKKDFKGKAKEKATMPNRPAMVCRQRSREVLSQPLQVVTLLASTEQSQIRFK